MAESTPKYRRALKYARSPIAMAAIAPIVIQKPARVCRPGRNSKFIPKMPVISVSGMKIAVIVVKVRITSFVLNAVDEKCS